MPHNAKSRAPIEICWLAQIKSSFSTSTVNGLPWSRRSPFTRGNLASRRIQFSSGKVSFRIADASKIFRFATLFSLTDTDVSRIVRVFRGFSIEISTPLHPLERFSRTLFLEGFLEGERERDLFGKWKMVLVISIFGLEKLDFRFEQGGEEGFGRILGLYRG